MDDILSDQPSASIHIYGDFNIHHKEWWVPSSNSEEGRYYHDFSIAYELTKIVDKPNRLSDIT